ncbi:hypothetical protein [Rhodocaloribacter sp.]
MFKLTFMSAALSLVLLGCGTENPFDRGPDVDLGSEPGPAPTGEVSFAANVMPVLSKCTACHAGGTGGWTYDGGAEAYAQALAIVDTDHPENSLMLRKGAGKDGHGGGVIFTVSSSEYQALLAWIQDGAPDN